MGYNHVLVEGVFWVPGEALVLTGLTIQMLGYIEAQNTNVCGKKREIESLVQSQLSIDCARVTMCVFVEFMLPQMASAATGTRWSNILALLISISTHIATEVYVIHNARDVRALKQERVSWFVGSGGVLLLSIIGLVLLLGYVVIAGKFISENLSRRIPRVLAKNKLENGDNLQEDFECNILQTWVVTRVCQPEYVIARSMFSAAAGGIVTCCVARLVVKVILLRSLVNGEPLFSLQCAFILIGWTLIFYRWSTSVLYFQEGRESWYNFKHVFIAGVSRFFQLQKIIFDFIVYDLMGMKNSAVRLKLRGWNFYLKLLHIVIKVLISPFFVVPWLAIYFTTATVTILMSMFFWGCLALLCRNKFIRLLCHVRKKLWRTADTDEELAKYHAVLRSVLIYGEYPESLWIANLRCFKNLKSSMGKAFSRGEGCKALISVMGSDPSGGSFVDNFQALEDLQKPFPGVNEQPWRLIAQLLVRMIIEVGDSFSPDDEQNNSIVHEAVRAYKQARDLMDFADCPDKVHVNVESFRTSNLQAFLLRYQAERDFRALKTMYRHWKLGRQVNREDDSVVEAVDKCMLKLFESSACIRKLFKHSLYTRKLAKDSKNPQESIEMLHSATNKHFLNLLRQAEFGYVCWEDLAPTYSMLQVFKLVLAQTIEDPQFLLNSLRSFLANVLCHSLLDLPEKVVESCNKWAAEFEEEKVSKAIDIAGKAWAVSEGTKKL